jgi:hypothetical protein
LIGLQVEAFMNTAEQIGIPIVLGSQVSRYFKMTANKRPDDGRSAGIAVNRGKGQHCADAS